MKQIVFTLTMRMFFSRQSMYVCGCVYVHLSASKQQKTYFVHWVHRSKFDITQSGRLYQITEFQVKRTYLMAGGKSRIQFEIMSGCIVDIYQSCLHFMFLSICFCLLPSSNFKLQLLHKCNFKQMQWTFFSLTENQFTIDHVFDHSDTNLYFVGFLGLYLIILTPIYTLSLHCF